MVRVLRWVAFLLFTFIYVHVGQIRTISLGIVVFRGEAAMAFWTVVGTACSALFAHETSKYRNDVLFGSSDSEIELSEAQMKMVRGRLKNILNIISNINTDEEIEVIAANVGEIDQVVRDEDSPPLTDADEVRGVLERVKEKINP